jgi:nitroreductase
MNSIFNRRSIRKYTTKKVSDDIVKELLKAGMSAPSAANEQPWEFIVVRDESVLQRIIDVHGYASMLKEADVAIVVCGDKNRDKVEGFWVQDCSAATENILIEAQELGLGAVWLGVYPLEERAKPIKNILKLPESIIPLSIISIGYPAEHKEPSNRYDESRIHYNKW